MACVDPAAPLQKTQGCKTLLLALRACVCIPVSRASFLEARKSFGYSWVRKTWASAKTAYYMANDLLEAIKKSIGPSKNEFRLQ